MNLPDQELGSEMTHSLEAEKVAIVTDSVACLNRDQVTRYSINIVPLRIVYDGRTYGDWVDITPTEAYELFLKNPDVFSTSSPSPADFLKAFRQASTMANNILCITVSSKLSTTNNAARIAMDYAENELPGISVNILDSWTATAAEGFIVLAAATGAQDGKSLPEVVKVAEHIKDKVQALVLLDTIRYVYRSGRIPRIAAQAGALLKIRPIFSLSGTVNLSGVVRSREHGIVNILEKIKNKVGEKPVHIAVMHAYALEEAVKLKERITNEFNCVEIWISEFSPIMGYACGTGTLGLAFYADD
jgi:DegV family protein with EDD domain